MNETDSIQQIVDLAVAGFDDWSQLGDIRTQHLDHLLLLNYTRAAQYNQRWNSAERVCRGLIVDTARGEIAARPFDRFFNWGEGGRRASKGAHITSVTEKLDGSLGILYRYQDRCQIATRGSFTGGQAVKATEMLPGNLDLPECLTLLFEIIYPENRIVVDYGERQELVLLAARDRFTGEYLPFFPDVYELAQQNGFGLPSVFQFNSVLDILEAREQLAANEEGWVVEFSDGQYFKFKGDRYLEIHRLISGMSFKRVLEAIRDDRFEDMIQHIPDEFLDQIREWGTLIHDKVQVLESQVATVMKTAPKDDRKQFAQWVHQEHPRLAPYLFRALDGKPFKNVIFKKEF